jgi:hypothetical protein
MLLQLAAVAERAAALPRQYHGGISFFRGVPAQSAMMDLSVHNVLVLFAVCFAGSC